MAAPSEAQNPLRLAWRLHAGGQKLRNRSHRMKQPCPLLKACFRGPVSHTNMDNPA